MLKNIKQALAKGREPTGPLSGKQLAVGERVVKVDRLLGEGGFATIYRCTDVESGDTYALKYFMLTGYPEAQRDVSTEVGVMERLAGCPYAVRLVEAAYSGPPGSAPTSAVVLMDYCPDTLVAFLQQRAWQLDDYHLLRVFIPICAAVAAMHALQPPLAHRDLKAENVLLAPGGRWVLCDFGSASTRHGVLESAHDIALEEEVVRRYTTPAYRAPELFDLYAREYIGLPVDIWALGVLLYLLAFGRLPFEGEAKLQVLNGRYVMPEGRPPALRALLKSMLAVAPRERPTIQQVLARLQELAPPDLWQAVAAAEQPTGEAAGAGASSDSGAAPLHGRAPSQGWADFAAQPEPSVGSSSASPGGGGGHGRRESGSLASWATFSPKRAAEAVASAAGAAAASAGSFWSSLGEEAPSEPQEERLVVQERSSSRAVEEPPLPPPPAMQQPPPAVAAAPAPVAAPAAAARAAAPAVQRPLIEPAEVSPLSAGLAHMTLGGPAASTPAALGRAAAAPVAQPRPQPAAPAAVAPAPAAAAIAATVHHGKAGSLGSAGGEEMDMLREHCRVLEQLLEEKSEVAGQLRTLAGQQAAEIRTLRQRLQQAEQAGAGQAPQQQGSSSSAASAAAAATPLPGAATVSSTPASSRMGQNVQPLEVPGDSDWVSFSGAGSREHDAPTPTLLAPAGSVLGSSQRPNGHGGAAAEATPASAAPAEERLQVDLSSAALAGATLGPKGSAGLASWGEQQQRKPPMRATGSSSGMALSNASSGISSLGSGPGSSSLRSFPIPLTPGPSPLGGPGNSNSSIRSAQPSPVHTSSVAAAVAAAAAANGALSPAQSPMHSRPDSSMSGRSMSPQKSQHRRTATAPSSGFFEPFSDLDPLH